MTPMKSIDINTFEELHHLCLMFGLKKAYMRYPFLAVNVLATPPPFHRNPQRKRLFIGSRTNPVCVQYHKKDIVILYDDERVTDPVITEFSKALMEEYLHLRHPYMLTEWDGRRLVESSVKTQVAEIR